jgi:hypothetical protein
MIYLLIRKQKHGGSEMAKLVFSSEEEQIIDRIEQAILKHWKHSATTAPLFCFLTVDGKVQKVQMSSIHPNYDHSVSGARFNGVVSLYYFHPQTRVTCMAEVPFKSMTVSVLYQQAKRS